jgi:competence protein CoiA
MLTAIKDRHKVIARDVERNQAPFICPGCNSEVVLKKGLLKTHHFAHKASCNCQFGQGESELHRQAKQEIYDNLCQVDWFTCEMEKSFDSVRSDIWVKSERTDREYAIEIQISNLSLPQIIHRTKCYKQLGIYVLWLPVLAERPALLSGELSYRPNAWEKWLHALNYGRVYYWHSGLSIQPVHFEPEKVYVPIRSYYDQYGYEQTSGGYTKTHKSIKSVVYGKPVNFVSDFKLENRNPWFEGEIEIPQAKILVDRFDPWWKMPF